MVRREFTIAVLCWRRVEIISNPSGPRNSNSWKKSIGQLVAAEQTYRQMQKTYHHPQTHPTCIHILWLTNTRKHTAKAKCEHLVITIRLVENMLCCLASQTQPPGTQQVTEKQQQNIQRKAAVAHIWKHMIRSAPYILINTLLRLRWNDDRVYVW